MAISYQDKGSFLNYAKEAMTPSSFSKHFKDKGLLSLRLLIKRQIYMIIPGEKKTSHIGN